MAWRIDAAVVRGEIDNCTRGRVVGRIWFLGRKEPVELELAGNAWRDMAGRRLEFTNPDPKPADLANFASLQSGVVGDCTASRKVKVPDIPMDQIGAYYAARKPWTWHWGNSLYLEWFSTTNGRVVIESASYQLVVSSDSVWEMTAEEEEQQRRANAEALTNFMGRLEDAVGLAGEDDDTNAEENEEADEPKPLTEEEAERRAEENDRLVDRVHARMEREGEDADFEKIIEEELERRRQERGEEPPTEEERARNQRWMEELEAAEQAVEAQPELDDDDSKADDRHPLVERAHALAVTLMREPEERGWLPEDANEEHPLVDLGVATAKAGAKLAGALGREAWPPALDFCADTIVRLKRARGYLDDALLAAEVCRQQKLGEKAWLLEAQGELTALAHECDLRIGELRARLAEGSE